MAQAGAIATPRNELVDISELLKNLVPLFTSSNKSADTATTKTSSSALDPSVLSQSDQLMATLMARATSTQQTDALVADIMHRAAIAFSPVLADERAAGGYNSTTRKLLGDEAMARATQAAAAAVLENQQKALDAATQINNAKLNAAANTATKTENTATSTRDTTPAAISGKQALTGAGVAGLMGLLGGKEGPIAELIKGLGISSGANVLGSQVKKLFEKPTVRTGTETVPGDFASEGTAGLPFDESVIGPQAEQIIDDILTDVASDVSAPTAFGPGGVDSYASGVSGAYTPESVEVAESALFGEYPTIPVSENVATIEQLLEQLGLPQQLSYNSPLVSEIASAAGDLPGTIQLAGYTGAVEGVDVSGLSEYVGSQYAAADAAAAAEVQAATDAATAAGAEEVVGETISGVSEAVSTGAGEVVSAGADVASAAGGEALAGGAGETLATTAQYDAFASEMAGYGYTEAEIASYASEYGITQFAPSVSSAAEEFISLYGADALAEIGGVEALSSFGAEELAAYGLEDIAAGIGVGETLGTAAAAAGIGEAFGAGELILGGTEILSGAAGAFGVGEAVAGTAAVAEGLTAAEVLPILLWVVCTELQKTGELDPELYARAAPAVHKVSKTTIRGYHVWAVPYTRWMRRSKFARKLMAPIANGRARYMVGDWNFLGAATVYIAEPICWILGKLCGKRKSNWRELYVTGS